MSRGLPLEDSKIDKETTKEMDEKYDLRESDFDEKGVVITVKEAYEKYKEEAIRNIEEEERRKLEEEEEKRRLEEGEGEGEQEGMSQENREAPPANTEGPRHRRRETKEDERKFMTEESFLDKLKEMKNGGNLSPLQKHAKEKKVQSPQPNSSNSGNSDKAHHDIPDMDQMTMKSKSVKIKLKTSEESEKLQDEKHKENNCGNRSKRNKSVKKKLNIKSK